MPVASRRPKKPCGYYCKCIPNRDDLVHHGQIGRDELLFGMLCDTMPPGVQSLLLHVDPSTVLEEDQNSEKPLALVWDQFAEKMDGKRTLYRIIGTSMDDSSSHLTLDTTATTTTTTTTNQQAMMEDLNPMEKAQMVQRRLDSQKVWFKRWKTVNLFLRAAFGFAMDNEDWDMVDNNNNSQEEEKKDSPAIQRCNSCSPSVNGPRRKFRILHAISAIKCHHSLFLLAAALHPEQAFEVDNNDLKRLHQILSQSKDDHDDDNQDQYSETHHNVTALHFAAASRAQNDAGKLVLTQLLELNPDAARSVDSDMCTPLHRIAENPPKNNWIVDGVSELYQANQAAVRLADMKGRLPIHRAAIAITYHTHLSEVELVARSKICRFLQLYESGAQHADIFGCFPLHLVAQYGKGWDAQVQSIYDANPAAVRGRTGVKYGNRLPLHLAAANPHAEFSMINKLVELNPRGAAQADRSGMYPLHIACETGLNWKCMQVIYDAYPEAVHQVEQNDRGWTALHMAAVCKDIEPSVVTHLVELNPAAVSIADTKGDYPFHLACKVGKVCETGLSTLFEANADAIRYPDSHGFLPLHIVSFLYSSENASAFQPSGLQVIDVRGRDGIEILLGQDGEMEISN
jgi:ankyrin repeat protein